MRISRVVPIALLAGLAGGWWPAGLAAAEETALREWSLEFNSGLLISNVRDSHLEGYTLVPAGLTAALKLDADSPEEGICRGYTEFLFRATGLAVAHGPESRLIGANFGPRYNFVQEAWPVEPFIESTVGFGFADSRGGVRNGHDIGLGQDFSFNFTVSGGVRYPVGNAWFVRLAAFYTHYSNAGLSEPKRENRAIDALGPEFSIGCSF